MRDGFRIEKVERKGRKFFARLSKIGWVVLTRRGGTPCEEGVPKEVTFDFVNGKRKAIIQYEIKPPRKTENGRIMALDHNCGQHGTAEVALENVQVTEEKVEVEREMILKELHEYLHIANTRSIRIRRKTNGRSSTINEKPPDKRRGQNDSGTPRTPFARARRRIANRIKDQNHKLSRKIANSVELLFVEDLKGKNMIASARGTIENPGRNVKQKAGLNVAILLMAWYQILMMLTYKCKTVIAVPAHHASQMCSRCGHVDKANRPYQEVFRCVKFNHEVDHGLCEP